MATKQSSKAKKAIKNRSKRVPSVKRIEAVRPLLMSLLQCGSDRCGTR